ncbi:hypothetical protein [Staphylococcus equorum]|uniref:Uncharacterized protein n=1 Tax=Staphylococcus equorum TaxID=246432 RepID=A0AAP7IFA4_9STAP|nr:hypothetical protein [Staphylococcus equorum]OEK58944.1 hypothetical protein ASS94_01055 [Staphylococcus equorum]
MTNFKNLKTWLKKNKIGFELGYSEVEIPNTVITEERQDFVVLKDLDIHIYDDEEGLTFDYDEEGQETFKTNAEAYKELKEQIETHRQQNL